ncbi:hypothetical protein L210DRAFT_3398358 [Boletus edulis BED1]|uniref:Uncharacterized protein n=1 Tax=Boletus edulis BED1 TaxID=1328754 RepID=A0AAD4BXH2_BOLED|nr:hypothetical protein L210DRAFT_3398358 [Boletus edulis BED1]
MLKSLFALSLFATATFAQNAALGLPMFNQTVNPGSDLIVQVQRPNSLTGSEEVAVVIGLQSCSNRPCTPPSDFLGNILYNGPFKPQYHEQYLPPYQNFTVQIPSTASGTALIGVAHITLVGAGLYPYLETLNQTITIA